EGGDWFRWFSSAVDDAGEPIEREIMRVDDLKQPNCSIAGSFVSGFPSLALTFPAGEPGLLAGDVVALDPQHPGAVHRASDTELPVGVVTDAPGLLLGEDMSGVRPELLEQADAAARREQPDLAQALRQEWSTAQRARTDRVFVAVAGRVLLRVDPASAAVKSGDRLSVGRQPGKALRGAQGGAGLGIALGEWSGGDAPLAVLLAVSSAEAGAGIGRAPQASSHDAVWGSGSVPAGSDSAIVRDEALTAAHLPVVTFYGDPGSRFWIAERGAGYFVLRLAEPAAAGVSFGFEAALQH
ncbi:MAG TPA: hypothetical protein VK824_03145, partial [Planctomycetota bacterium]|nr:hypothetical protein [Planctomycetota bacterium]